MTSANPAGRRAPRRPHPTRDGCPVPAPLDTSALLDFFLSAERAFDSAARAVGVERQSLLIAEKSVELNVAGRRLAERILPALIHNAGGDAASADLRVNLWDQAETGVALPDPPWRHGGIVRRGEIEGLRNERFQIALEAGFGAYSLFDRETRRAIFVAPDAKAIPYYESAAPIRSIMSWWLAERGRQLVHGGAVGLNGRGVLLAGKGGSGKSTTSLLCLEAGFQYVSDDYTILSLDPAPTAHSLYNSAKIRAEDAARFPRLFSKPRGDARDEKQHIFVREQLPEQVVGALRVEAVLLPRVLGEGPTEIVPVSAAEALRALAPSTIFQLPGAGAPAFSFLAALIRNVQVRRLNLGASRSDVARCIREFLG